MNDFNHVFISHRSFDRDKAKRLRKALLANGMSNRVVLWEEESLCRNNELLTVHNYFEAIERIKESMRNCTAFLYIDSPVLQNGFFTGAELLQWRRLHDKPYAYCVREVKGDFYCYKMEIVPLTKEERRRISLVSYLSSPDRLYDTEGGTFMDSWGKYAKECFLLSCCSCGKYYLITRNKVNFYLGKNTKGINIPAKCPHCHQYHAMFEKDVNGRKFFDNRVPVVTLPFVRRSVDHEPLSVDDVIDLMDTSKLPQRFPLDKLPDDKLKSDFRKQVGRAFKTTLMILGAIGVGLKLANSIDSKTE